MLTAYDGAARTYDDVGNLWTDGTWAYTWQNGRELVFMTDGPTAWSYTYDANGMRTDRTFGTTIYKYVYNGSQLVEMTVGDDALHFTYGLLGPTTVTWNGTTEHRPTTGQMVGNDPAGVKNYTIPKKRPPLYDTRVAVNFDMGDFSHISRYVLTFDIFRAPYVVFCKKWKKAEK